MALNSLSDDQRGSLIVCSMDAKALFPSIKIARSSEAVQELLLESSIDLRGINVLELSRYLAYLLSEEEVAALGLTGLVMKRKRRGGRPVITGEELRKSWADRVQDGSSIWESPMRGANPEELRVMLAVAVSKDVSNVMSSHLFRFGDDSYKQKEGGSIGSELTCIVAKVRMILWIRMMNSRCLEVGLVILASPVYVDDSLFAMQAVGKGLRLSEDERSLVFSQHSYDFDRDLPDDVVSGNLLVSIANGIEDDIIMSFDSPAKNGSGWMPILDLQIRVVDSKVEFMFYEKPMTSDFVILKSSAVSWGVKRATLVSEVARRLFNTSPHLVQEGYADVHIQRINWKMLMSGYNVEERLSITREAFARYKNVCKLVAEGRRPMYRSSEWKKQERAVERVNKKSSWYGDNESVVFVQATPGSVLKREVMEVLKQEGWKIRVEEVAGRSLRGILQRSDVGPGHQCHVDDCPVCSTSGSGKCSVESVGYKVTCLRCVDEGEPAVLHGETGRTARVRCSEHRDLLHKRKGSLWPHCRDYHGGSVPEFSYEVVSSFRDVLLRQIDEATRIRSEGAVLMNSKDEFVRPAGFQVVVERM